jgi:hypothetical protein
MNLQPQGNRMWVIVDVLFVAVVLSCCGLTGFAYYHHTVEEAKRERASLHYHCEAAVEVSNATLRTDQVKTICDAWQAEVLQTHAAVALDCAVSAFQQSQFMSCLDRNDIEPPAEG